MSSLPAGFWRFACCLRQSGNSSNYSLFFILPFITTYNKLSLLLGILSASNYQLRAPTILK